MKKQRPSPPLCRCGHRKLTREDVVELTHYVRLSCKVPEAFIWSVLRKIRPCPRYRPRRAKKGKR